MKVAIRLAWVGWFVFMVIAAGPGQPDATASTAQKGPIEINLVPGENFGPLEVWGDGKKRRWITNDARLIIENPQAQARTINLRFVAESFFQERTLDILFEDELIEQVRVPPAPLFIVVKNLNIPPGEKTIVFHSPEGPENIDARLGTGDKRNVSIAFGEFDWIESSLPKAKKERSGAFSQRPAWYDWLTADENEAYNLQREGRFSETAEVYQKATAAKSAHPSTYIWLGLSLLIVNEKDEARQIFQETLSLRGWRPKVRAARRSARRLIDYLSDSEIINHPQEDKGLSLRSSGEIARAVRLYQEMLKENPMNLYAHYWLGLMYFVAERPEEAIPHMNKVTELAPETHDAKFFKEVKFYRNLATRPTKIVTDIFRR